MVAAKALNMGGMSNSIVVYFVLCGMILFFLLDIQIIVGGYYCTFSKDDYVMASMKMFADYILIFGLLLDACSSS